MPPVDFIKGDLKDDYTQNTLDVMVPIYRIFSYSFFASIRVGRSGSASFHSEKKSWYALRLFVVSPVSAAARASSRCASGYKKEVGSWPRFSMIFWNSAAASVPARRRR